MTDQGYASHGTTGRLPAPRWLLLGAVILLAAVGCDVEDTEDASDPTTPATVADTTEPEPEETTEEPADEPADEGETFVSDDTTDEGCPIEDDRVMVSPDCVDAEWPLTVAQAEVYCAEPSAALLRVPAGQPGGGIYGLNGMADSQFPDLPDLENVWLEDPNIEGARVSIGPLTSIALDQCEE